MPMNSGGLHLTGLVENIFKICLFMQGRLIKLRFSFLLTSIIFFTRNVKLDKLIASTSINTLIVYLRIKYSGIQESMST